VDRMEVDRQDTRQSQMAELQSMYDALFIAYDKLTRTNYELESRVVAAEARVADLRAGKGDAEARVAQAESDNKDLRAKLHEMSSALRDFQQQAQQDEEDRLRPQSGRDGSAEGICIRWKEASHYQSLGSLFTEVARACKLPGPMCKNWEPGRQYAVVLLVLYPATPRLDDFLATVRECQEAAPSVVVIALRWGLSPPELNAVSLRDRGVAVVSLYFDKDHSDQKHLLPGAKNDRSVEQLRELVHAAVPERPGSLASRIGNFLRAFDSKP